MSPRTGAGTTPNARRARGRVAQEHQQPRVRERSCHPTGRVRVREVGRAALSGQDRMEATPLSGGPLGERREAGPIPAHPVRVPVRVEVVHLRGSRKHVRMGVELAEQVGGPAPSGADDHEVGAEVPRPEHPAA